MSLRYHSRKYYDVVVVALWLSRCWYWRAVSFSWTWLCWGHIWSQGTVGRITIYRSFVSLINRIHCICCLWQHFCGYRSCWSLFTQRRSWSFAEYCKYFVVRLNDVRAFGYNSAGSERIWMKFGELRAPSLWLGAVPDKFWARSAQKRLREEERKCCFLSIK